MPLTFVAGAASDVFSRDVALAVESELQRRFALAPASAGEAYRSDEVDGRGWTALQQRVPQLSGIDAYQAVFISAAVKGIAEISLPNIADPWHIASLDTLTDTLRDFAAQAELPTDDVELMQLAARYLEDDDLIDADLDIQTYVQLMLTVKQAAAHRWPLWFVS